MADLFHLSWSDIPSAGGDYECKTYQYRLHTIDRDITLGWIEFHEGRNPEAMGYVVGAENINVVGKIVDVMKVIEVFCDGSLRKAIDRPRSPTNQW